MENLILTGTYLFGFIIVFMFSIKEFNSPEYPYKSDDSNSPLNREAAYTKLARPTLPKYMADRSRYTVFMLLFSLFAVALYFLFTKLLLLIPGWDFLGDDPNNLEALAALIAALLLIGVVKADEIQPQKLQFFMKWPKKILFGLIKDWLHGFAFIPHLNFSIFNQLCYLEFDIGSTDVLNNFQRITEKQYRDDIDVEKFIQLQDFKFSSNPANLIPRWARLSYLVFILDQWSEDTRFMNQVKERSLGWLSLRDAYVILIEKIARFRDKDVEMSQEEELELSEQVNHLLANCYRLISCAVIMTSKPSQDPLKFIADIGFKVNYGSQPAVHQGEFFRIVFAMVPTIIAATYLISLFEYQNDTIQLINRVLVYIESAFIIFLLPMIIAIGLKRHLSLDNAWRVVSENNPYKSFFDRPLWLYSGISVVSWLLSTLLMVVLLTQNKLNSSPIEWKYMAVFCFISAITAFITCYRVDTPPRVYKSRLKLLARTIGLPAIHGFLTAITVWVGLNMVPRLPENSEAFWKFPLLGFCISMAIGMALFYGKHCLEKRRFGEREYCRQPVTIIQNKQQYSGTMLNRSQNGMMAMIHQTWSRIKANSKVEVVFDDGPKRIGTIVDLDEHRMNVAYVDG
jgi:hypothetical protein